MVRKLLTLGCVVAVLGTVGCRPPNAGPATTVAKVSGPVTGGKGVPWTSAPPALLASTGYQQAEYYIEGTAQSYSPQGQFKADGRWSLRPNGTAAYKSRVVVRRPQDPARFSGTVIVEWFNVSGGTDIDADFGFLHPEITDAGDAYVGVSAQSVGIEGGGISIPNSGVSALKTWDPARYGSLKHPGDAFSYDIFTQVGRALKRPSGVDLLGGLEPRKVIAAGESQSAARMFNYVNGVQPLAKAFDGFFIHSRFAGGGFGLSNVAAAGVRTDLDVPVQQIITETDLALFVNGRQPDTDKVRTWEIAGTAHADKALLDYQIAAITALTGQTMDDVTRLLGCSNINDGPQRYVVRRAYADLKRWANGGAPPAKGPLLTTTTGATLARDSRGIVLGGIRTPAVDVPVAVHSGQAAAGASGLFCGLFGSTTPLDGATLRSLYPTHADYMAKMRASAQDAVAKGFLRAGDADAIVAAADAAAVPPPA